MVQKDKTMEVIILYSKNNRFPIRIQFMDKDNKANDYILFKTRKDKLILQKPLFKANFEK